MKVGANKINNRQVADFGLSRSLYAENYYVSGSNIFPRKWTGTSLLNFIHHLAPEAIRYGKWTTASDVWSYASKFQFS